jgi:3-oxoacid CoA-transferase subunit A
MKVMAIKNWIITGDTHSQVANRLGTIRHTMSEYVPEETAVIILGDAGLLYYLDKKDTQHKREANIYGYTIYCVHGNHEARPSEKLGMKLIHDDDVGGPVWIEDEFPLIRYFCDWGHYDIGGRKTLVIGGAYSVDKWYRLQNGWRWFEDEQLKDFEMDACYRNAIDYQFDMILSHTCPVSLQPTDLFLGCIDQSTVDNTMELWMDKVRSKIRHRLWLWGHYHGDRIEAPYCEMFYTDVECLENIEARWKKYDETGKLDWWLPVSPKMKKIMNKE